MAILWCRFGGSEGGDTTEKTEIYWKEIELFAVGTLGLGTAEFWAMPFREYMCKVHGFTRETQTRRAELRAITYPIYATTLAALGGKNNRRVKPEDYLPTGIKEEPEEKLQDPNGYIKQAFHRLNPHYADSRTKRNTRS